MQHGIVNIVIGKPLVPWWELCCSGERNENGTPLLGELMEEVNQTFFTEERNLAKILKEIGVVESISEVRRNRPELCKPLTKPNCFWLKWGKNRFWVIVGEEEHNED